MANPTARVQHDLGVSNALYNHSAQDLMSYQNPSDSFASQQQYMQQQTQDSRQFIPVTQQHIGSPLQSLNRPVKTLGTEISDSYGVTGYDTQYGNQQMPDHSLDVYLERAFNRFDMMLKDSVRQIRAGSTLDASRTLWALTNWIVQSVSDLGLTTDDPSLFQDRCAFWRDLNNGWLYLFRCEVMNITAGSSSPEQMLSQVHLELIGREIVRWADTLEPKGLVDYELGFYEEKLIDGLKDDLRVTYI